MSNSTRPSSSNSSGYDERFVVPLEASRRGAHRARVSPVMAALPVIAVVAIVVGAIAVVYLVLGGGGSGTGSDAAAKAGPTASSSPTPQNSDGPSPTEGSASATPGAVDKTVTVNFFNGTATSGLARKAATKLEAAGWTTGKIETWTQAPVTQTTVYYGTAAQKATAQAVVKALGRGTVKLSGTKAGTGLAVVIGPDYPGATRSGTASTRSARPTATGASDTSPSDAPSLPTDNAGDAAPTDTATAMN